MHRLTTTLATAALLGMLVAGCGEEQPGPTSTPAGARADGSTTDTTPAGTPAGSPTGDPATSPTVPPSDGLEKVRVVGEVVRDGDCVVVRDEHAITWTISGDGSAALAA